MVEAFRAEGLRLGFYYSLIDWHHPEYPIDALHSMRTHPQVAELNKTRDVSKYAEFMRNQLTELLTQFGQIDILWFDGSCPNARFNDLKGKGKDDWESEKLFKLVRELQPNIILNNRLDLPPGHADIHTPEQFQPTEWVTIDGQPVYWETCQTFSGSWGYYRDETSWKSPEQLVQMLINSVSLGGNLLMNVGPTARGTFDARAQDALAVYRDWMRLHGRSIYGCTMSEFEPPTDVRYTQNGKRLYVHILSWPFRHLHLPGLGGRVEYAQLLNDASEVQLRESGAQLSGSDGKVPENVLTLELPVIKPDALVPVVELFLK